MNNNTIKVFEYGTLRVNDKFRTNHFKKLVHYNEKHGNKFFSVGNGKIYFKQYVGVIQVGNLVIEILPKADKSSSEDIQIVDKWRNALINMLRECGFIKIDNLTKANLKLRTASLIDLFFETFLDEVQALVHGGLINNYRHEEGNLNKLKGRLIFSKNISMNMIHKERCYTAHQRYDRDNIFNQILNKALNVLVCITNNQSLIKRANNLQLAFDDVRDISINDNSFSKIRYDRSSERYKYAVTLARLIILNYSPDLKGGNENVLAILFDMNMLFEKFIYRRLKKEENNFAECKLKIRGQTKHNFWHRKRIKPDIILEYKQNGISKRLIIDTKWKLLNNDGPSDADLKQMFVYNVHLNSFHSILMYPDSYDEIKSFDTKPFELSPMLNNQKHFCGQYFVNLFDDYGRIKKELGKELIGNIISLIDQTQKKLSGLDQID